MKLCKVKRKEEEKRRKIDGQDEEIFFEYKIYAMHT
jgi:hypothetical protein